MKKLIIFDFDGTAVDTITDVVACFNAALEECGFCGYTVEGFSRYVGGDLETIVTNLLPEDARTSANIDRVKMLYRRFYLESVKPNTKPYPGMPELMQKLKLAGCKLAVNSNKGQLLLEDMVEKLFPFGFFDAVVGYLESRPSKPDPCGVDMICEACGCSRADAVYVGDGKSDLTTANNAGIPCILVTWGQGTPELWNDPRVYAKVDTAQQLEAVLQNM